MGKIFMDIHYCLKTTRYCISSLQKTYFRFVERERKLEEKSREKRRKNDEHNEISDISKNGGKDFENSSRTKIDHGEFLVTTANIMR